MQRFKQPNMDLHPDGEWIRYSDHCEAMKRIAGEGAEPAGGISFADWYAGLSPQWRKVIESFDTAAAPSASAQQAVVWCLVNARGEIQTWVTPCFVDPRNGGLDCIRRDADRMEADAAPFAWKPLVFAAPPESRQGVASGDTQKPVATIRVTNNGYSMTLSTYVAYALPEGKHDLYAAPVPSAAPPESRQMVASGEQQAGPVAQLLAAAQEALTVIGRIRPEGHGLGTEVRLQRAISAVSPSTEASRCDGTVAKCPNECSAPCSPITSVAPIAAPAALMDEAAMRVALRIMANLEDRNGLLDGVDDDTKADIADEIAVTIRAASPAALTEDQIAVRAGIPFVGLSVTLMKALRRLSFAAQTSGGVAGRDDELMGAIKQAQEALEAAKGKGLEEVAVDPASASSEAASPAALTGDARKLLTHALFWMGRTPISKESTDGMNAVRADVEALLLAAPPAEQVEDARDAARYQWMLSHLATHRLWQRKGAWFCLPNNATEERGYSTANAAIDAAMSASKEGA